MEVIKCQQTYRLRGIFKVTCEYKRKGKWAAGWHTGIDLYSDNQRIYGTCNGIVSATGFDKSYGNYIVVKNLEVENYHWYCHLSEIYVTVGERVSRNTIIGKMGNTGNSTGTHLHFEIRQKCNCYGKTENVADYMGISNKVGTYNTRNYQIKTNNAAEEIKILNNLVSGYFDFAEIQAIRHNPMYMKDYIKQLDMILSSTGEKMLNGSGSISHKKAIQKAKAEYKTKFGRLPKVYDVVIADGARKLC